MFLCKNAPLPAPGFDRANRDRVHRLTSQNGLDWGNESVVATADSYVQGGKAYSASSTSLGSAPGQAFDGDTESFWSSGDYAPAWVQVDLGSPHSVDHIKLVVAQTPAGPTLHRIYLFGEGGVAPPGDPIVILDGYTSDRQELYVNVSGLSEEVRDNVRYVRVETASSSSWVAWREIKVYGVSREDPEGLSCTPGVVKDFHGAWHMYYVTAPLAHGDETRLFHATSTDNGVSWIRQGEIPLPSSFRRGFALEHPAPHVVGNSLALFLTGPGDALYRIESTNGFDFPSDPARLSSRGGRVSRIGGRFYNLIPDNSVCRWRGGTQFLVSESNDGWNFDSPQFLFSASAGDFDDCRTFNGSILGDGSPGFSVYYGGNHCPPPGWFFGAGTAIGLRRFTEVVPPPTPLADSPGSRRDIVKLILAARGECPTDQPPVPEPPFADVPRTDRDSWWIDKAFAMGLTQGCQAPPLRLFCPEDPLRRDQSAAFLTRGMYLPNPVPTAPNPGWTDVDPNSPYLGFINRLWADGITVGCSASPLMYCPEQLTFRSQVKAFVSRYWPSYSVLP